MVGVQVFQSHGLLRICATDSLDLPLTTRLFVVFHILLETIKVAEKYDRAGQTTWWVE